MINENKLVFETSFLEDDHNMPMKSVLFTYHQDQSKKFYLAFHLKNDRWHLHDVIYLPSTKNIANRKSNQTFEFIAYIKQNKREIEHFVIHQSKFRLGFLFNNFSMFE